MDRGAGGQAGMRMGARPMVCAVLGMAPVFSLFRRDGAAALFETASETPYSSRLFYLLLLGLILAGACLGLFGRLRVPGASGASVVPGVPGMPGMPGASDPRAVSGRSSSRAALWLPGAASLLASAVCVPFYLAGGVDACPTPVAGLLCLAVAAWVVVMVPTWGMSLAQADQSAVAWAIFLSYVMSLLPSTVGTFVEGFLGFAVAFEPLASGALWYLGFAEIAAGRAAGGSVDPAIGPRGALRLGDPPRIPSAAFLGFGRNLSTFALLVILGGVIRGFLNNGSFQTTSSPTHLVTHVISIALVACVVFMAFRRGDGSTLPSRAWTVLSVFLVGSLLLVAFASVRVTELFPVGRSLVIAGNTCLTVLYWGILVCMAKGDGLAAVGSSAAVPSAAESFAAGAVGGRGVRPEGTLFYLFIAVEALSSFCSYLLVPSFAQFLGVSLEDQMFVCALAMAFMVVVVSFALMGGDALRDVRLADEPERLDVREILAERYGLTEREAQIAELVARGHTIDGVADRLALAPSTVRSYSKGVYRKLGVHKKQEVVDLVARILEGRGE